MKAEEVKAEQAALELPKDWGKCDEIHVRRNSSNSRARNMALASSHHLNPNQRKEVYDLELERQEVERQGSSKLMKIMKKNSSMQSVFQLSKSHLPEVCTYPDDKFKLIAFW